LDGKCLKRAADLIDQALAFVVFAGQRADFDQLVTLETLVDFPEEGSGKSRCANAQIRVQMMRTGPERAPELR
jgi:hypothetical protein